MSDIFEMRDKEWCEALLAEKAKKIVELQAEIERLRAALQKIAKHSRGGVIDTTEKMDRDEFIGIARAALEGK